MGRREPYEQASPALRPAAGQIGPREARVAGYYGLPPLKESPYHWKTALSFLAEAVGGGPQVLAGLILVAGHPQDRGLVRAGRYLALAGSVAAPGLLISELHSPRRWLNMLRIFRPTSAMSIGNLSLTALGICSGLTALGQALEDRGHARQGLALGRWLALPAAFAGAMVCLYPGTELEETSVALWAGSHPLLSPLFAATGLSAGVAALTLAGQGEGVPEQSRDRLNRLAITVLAVQLAGALLVERAWRSHRFAAVQSPARDALFRAGLLGCGMVMPLVLRLLPGPDRRRRRENRAMAAAASLISSFLVYETVLEAGNCSAASATEYLRETRPGPPRRRERAAAPRMPGLLGLALLTAAGAAVLLLKRRRS